MFKPYKKKHHKVDSIPLFLLKSIERMCYGRLFCVHLTSLFWGFWICFLSLVSSICSGHAVLFCLGFAYLILSEYVPKWVGTDGVMWLCSFLWLQSWLLLPSWSSSDENFTQDGCLLAYNPLVLPETSVTCEIWVTYQLLFHNVILGFGKVFFLFIFSNMVWDCSGFWLVRVWLTDVLLQKTMTFISAMVLAYDKLIFFCFPQKRSFFSDFYCGQEGCGKLPLAPLVFSFEKLAKSLPVFGNCWNWV